MNPDEVVVVKKNDQILIPHTTFQVGELLQELTQRVNGESIEQMEKWFNNGVECRVLTPNKGWRKGKIKISVEFYPESEESPLKDIRKKMDKDTEN